MRTAGKTLLWFLAGFAVLASATILANPPSTYLPWAYHYFRDDYRKTGQVYDLMVVQTYQVHDLFMGSSHTYNGVDDRMVNAAYGPHTAYNASIPTSGRDFEYAVLKEVLEKSPPKRLFLEVRETEERTSHFGFPIVARGSDILTAPANPWWLKNALLAFQYRFEHLVWLAPVFRRQELSTVPPTESGFFPNLTQVPWDELNKAADFGKKNKQWRRLPAMFGDAEFAANETYVRKIAEICKRKGVELHFLHLPFVGAPAEPMQADFYRSLGTLHTMPDTIRNDRRLYADITHFNPAGAHAYTEWLIGSVLAKGHPKTAGAF